MILFSEEVIVFLIITTGILFFMMIFANLVQSYPIIKTTTYTHLWLSFSARMADDTLLSAAFTDTLLHTSKTRTNARRKIKTKTKQVLKRTTALTIGFDRDNYFILQALKPQRQNSSNNQGTKLKITEKPNEKRHTFKLQQKQKLYNNFEPRLDIFLALVAKAYQGMKQAS